MQNRPIAPFSLLRLVVAERRRRQLNLDSQLGELIPAGKKENYKQHYNYSACTICSLQIKMQNTAGIFTEAVSRLILQMNSAN